MKKKLIGLFVFIVVLTTTVPTFINGYLTEQFIRKDFPLYQKILRKEGINIEITNFKRAWLTSHADWQVDIFGIDPYHGTLSINHSPLLSAGKNWTRINIEGTNRQHSTLHTEATVDLSGRIHLENTFAPLNSLTINSEKITLSADTHLFRKNTVDLNISSTNGRYLTKPYSAFKFLLRSKWEIDNPQKTSDNALINWLIQNNITSRFQFNTLPEQESEYLDINGEIHESISTPLQILTLGYHKTLLQRIDGSKLNIRLANNSPYEQTIIKLLNQAPFSLNFTFTPHPDGKTKYSQWHIQNGQSYQHTLEP